MLEEELATDDVVDEEIELEKDVTVALLDELGAEVKLLDWLLEALLDRLLEEDARLLLDELLDAALDKALDEALEEKEEEEDEELLDDRLDMMLEVLEEAMLLEGFADAMLDEEDIVLLPKDTERLEL